MTKANRSTLVFHTVKTKTLATVLAIAAAVAIPQLFHLLGAASGLGTALGETFLPMHLAVFAVGFLAGPAVGGVVGALSPLVSFALTGMPKSMMLPFMMIELCAYGLVAGLLANVNLPSIVKLLIAQLAGRAVRAGAILIAVYAFSSPVAVASIWNSIVVGLPGLVLQWTLLPLLLYRITAAADHDA